MENLRYILHRGGNDVLMPWAEKGCFMLLWGGFNEYLLGQQESMSLFVLIDIWQH